MSKLCLNMIVRNESTNIARCLASVLPYVDNAVIIDTGSSDNTKAIIQNWFISKNKRLDLHDVPFINFSQARNAALRMARESALEWDYLLLIDADMELVTELRRFQLTEPAYNIKQTDGRQSLNNIRLLRRDQTVEYEGPTHEWLPIKGPLLEGVTYKDYCSGPSRANKAERDIALLEDALKNEPEHTQNLFNLAHSYYSDQQWEPALHTFGKRIQLGGYAEQVWNSMLYYGRCALLLKDEAAFAHQALVTFNVRPWRAEPLYDLARYWRANGTHQTSLVFSQLGLAIPYPAKDSLFIEDYVYNGALQHEYDRAMVALGLKVPKKRLIQPVNKLLAKR